MSNEMTVWIVDDDASICEALTDLFETAGIIAQCFHQAESFLQRAEREMPDCLILDVNLPDMNGLSVQNEIVARGFDAPIVFLTGQASVPASVRAIKAGAWEYLTKPFAPEAMLAAVRDCARQRDAENRAGGRNGLIGNSPALRQVLRQIELVAGTDATVLLTGESGTGKELVARAIHDQSARRRGRLIRVNCGAIPETLFESEFFGHVRGAFTGALRDKPGRFELADGGTLFLDEIGEVPLAQQAKLLRALQEREIERLGDACSRRVDVRIIAATNRDLAADVRAGRFREDLFYRLTVFPIENPPLRARPSDIPLLAQHFLNAAAKRLSVPIPRLTEEALHELSGRDWPGNVRELQNTIERAVILSKGGVLRFDLRRQILPAPAGRTAANEKPVITRSELKQRERDSITAALERSGGKVFGPKGAAVILGMPPTTLYSRITALGLTR